ncbi:MAG: helix-turn-helix domain-containing protein [Enterococcus gilvus]
MNRILILTKNILAEQEIQQKLQVLNYEVYCSAAVFEYCSHQLKQLDLFKYFPNVILSESICESEITKILPLLKEYPLNVIRKEETKLTELEQTYLEGEQLHAIISTSDSSDELRECMYKLKKRMEESGEQAANDKVVQLSGKVSLLHAQPSKALELTTEEALKLNDAMHRLSQTEMKILSILLNAGNHVVTRETICQKVWNEEPSNSHLASLSNTISRIRTKFEHVDIGNEAIHTMWGRGYRINQELLKKIQKDENINRFLKNG